jgi:hypothetical protein
MKEITRVLKNRIMIGAATLTAAAVPFAGMALSATPAGAKAPKGITCTAGTGSGKVAKLSATIKLTGCSGTTGKSGTTTGKEGAATGTIKWANGKATTFTENQGTGTACPTTAADDELITGNVTADNTKSTAVGAAVSGEFCVTINKAGTKFTLKMAPGTKFTIAA